jgi:cystathionine beta-lyase
MSASQSFDFDMPVDRAGSWSQRWERFRGIDAAGREILPLWVADMDFRAPPPVLEALARRIDHGVLGYSVLPSSLRDAIVRRMQRLYRWKIQPDWIVMLPGVVAGLHLAVRQLTLPHEKLLLPAPVYNPFRRAAELAPRTFEAIPLARVSGTHHVLDAARMEDGFRRGARMLLLCNPQNPGGAIYGRDELTRIAALAERHDALICSDEIHAELVLDADRAHVPIASLSPEVSRRTVTLMSPNKAFNIPGAGCGYAIIEDPGLRAAFSRDLHGLVPDPGVFSYIGALAAYDEPACETWLAGLIAYLRANRDVAEAALARIEGLETWHVEAGCLAWIDARAWGLDDPAAHFLKHGLALSPGSQFGAPGFVRLNFGTQRARLDEALSRMCEAARTR